MNTNITIENPKGQWVFEKCSNSSVIRTMKSKNETELHNYETDKNLEDEKCQVWPWLWGVKNLIV